MEIFISYSFENLNLVEKIATTIRPIGSVYYWDKFNVPGKSDWQQILEKISESDVVLALITENTIERSMSVGQEIGYALDKNKLIIPIVSTSISSSDLGCLKGITPVYIDLSKPEAALSKITEYLSKKKSDMQFNQGIALGAIVFGTLWLLASNKE